MNGSTKTEGYITLGQKGLAVANTLAYWAFRSYEENEVL
jgi:hypothetical protein